MAGEPIPTQGTNPNRGPIPTQARASATGATALANKMQGATLPSLGKGAWILMCVTDGRGAWQTNLHANWFALAAGEGGGGGT